MKVPFKERCSECDRKHNSCDGVSGPFATSSDNLTFSPFRKIAMTAQRPLLRDFSNQSHMIRAFVNQGRIAGERDRPAFARYCNFVSSDVRCVFNNEHLPRMPRRALGESSRRGEAVDRKSQGALMATSNPPNLASAFSSEAQPQFESSGRL